MIQQHYNKESLNSDGQQHYNKESLNSDGQQHYNKVWQWWSTTLQ